MSFRPSCVLVIALLTGVQGSSNGTTDGDSSCLTPSSVVSTCNPENSPNLWIEICRADEDLPAFTVGSQVNLLIRASISSQSLGQVLTLVIRQSPYVLKLIQPSMSVSEPSCISSDGNIIQDAAGSCTTSATSGSAAQSCDKPVLFTIQMQMKDLAMFTGSSLDFSLSVIWNDACLFVSNYSIPFSRTEKVGTELDSTLEVQVVWDSYMKTGDMVSLYHVFAKPPGLSYVYKPVVTIEFPDLSGVTVLSAVGTTSSKQNCSILNFYVVCRLPDFLFPDDFVVNITSSLDMSITQRWHYMTSIPVRCTLAYFHSIEAMTASQVTSKTDVKAIVPEKYYEVKQMCLAMVLRLSTVRFSVCTDVRGRTSCYILGSKDLKRFDSAVKTIDAITAAGVVFTTWKTGATICYHDNTQTACPPAPQQVTVARAFPYSLLRGISFQELLSFWEGSSSN